MPPKVAAVEPPPARGQLRIGKVGGSDALPGANAFDGFVIAMQQEACACANWPSPARNLSALRLPHQLALSRALRGLEPSLFMLRRCKGWRAWCTAPRTA